MPNPLDNNKELPLIQLPTGQPTPDDWLMYTTSQGQTKISTFDDFQQVLDLDLTEKVQQAQQILTQSQELLDDAVLVSDTYYPRGFFNASTNQANGTTTLTANAAAFNTGNPAGRQGRLEITVPGTVNFNGKNFTAGTALGLGTLYATPDNQWQYQPSKVNDSEVTMLKINPEVKSRNMPFAPTATNQVDGIKARTAILDIKLYNVDKTKKYYIGVFGKKPSGSSQYVIHIYQTSPAVLMFAMTTSGYVPASAPEVIKLDGPNDSYAILTVNWDLVADGAIETNMGLGHTEISPLNVFGPDDYSDTINAKLESQIGFQDALGRRIVSRSESLTFENTATRTITHAGLSGLILNFKKQNYKVNTFSFPGHSFVNASVKYAFCLVQTARGAKSLRKLEYDKRTDNYVFLLARMFNLSEGLKISFGYCDEAGNTFAPSPYSLDWASAAADPNLSAATVSYFNGVQSIYSAGIVASAGWSATRYKLSVSTNIVLAETAAEEAEMKFVLPSKLYPLTDSALWFYANGIIKNDQLYRAPEHGLRLTSRLVSGGTVVTDNCSYDDNYGWILGNRTANITFELVTRRYLNKVTAVADRAKVLATKVVNATAKARPTGKTWNVLVIGDSFQDAAWEGVGMLQKVIDFGALNTNTIRFRGTRTPNYGNANLMSEARGSWSEDTFFRYVPVANRAPVQSSEGPNLHSPFMFSPDDTASNKYFSFSEYMAAYGSSYGVLNAVVIALGTNPASSPTGTKIQEMITSIRAFNATLPVIVCTVPPASISRRGIDSPMDQLRKIEQTEALLTLFDGRDAEYIYICPWHLCVHRLYGMINTVVDTAKFASRNRVDPQLYLSGSKLANYGQQATKLYLSDQHPSDQGIHTYADALYDMLCYHIV